MDNDVHSKKDNIDIAKEGITGKSSLVVPFRRSNLKRSPLYSSKIGQKQFINIINFYNFADEQVFAHMVYSLTKEEFLFKVIPGPCTGNEITCTLPETTHLNFDNFIFKGLIIDSGKSIIVMQADPIRISSRSLVVNLRKSGTIYQTRHAKRFSCQMVDAVLQQRDMKIEGSLEEFNPSGLRISLKGVVGQTVIIKIEEAEISIWVEAFGKVPDDVGSPLKKILKHKTDPYEIELPKVSKWPHKIHAPEFNAIFVSIVLHCKTETIFSKIHTDDRPVWLNYIVEDRGGLPGTASYVEYSGTRADSAKVRLLTHRVRVSLDIKPERLFGIIHEILIYTIHVWNPP